MSAGSERASRPPLVELNAPGWLAARRHGVPVGMVAEATRRREVGDWRGAAVAAGFDVRLDLTAIGDEFGADVVVRVEDDLRHLAPDLARWHLPRWWRGGSGLLAPATRVPLARYGPGPTAPCLWLATPPHSDRPQRVELRFSALNLTELSTDSWERARYLWDARATDGLLRRVGGGERAPFFHRDGRPLAPALPDAPPQDDPVALTEWIMLRQDAGEYERAWAAAGIAADFAPPDAQRAYRAYQLPREELAASVIALAPLLRAWGSAPRVVLRSPPLAWRATWVVLTVDGDQLAATLQVLDRPEGLALPAVPRPLWQRLPDVELLRFGLLDATALHPLVRSALFPEAPAAEYAPAGAGLVPATVPVRCRGVWHRVGWAGGRVEPRDHTPEEAQRERVMRSLGGGVPGCFTVTETWRGTAPGRLPRALRELRHHALSAVLHGDTDEFVRLLDLGIDPAGVRDRWGRGPLHLLAKVDGVRVLGRLLAAGLDINGKNLYGRTPLGCVLYDGAPATLIRAMLDAGADPSVADDTGATALHLLRSADATAILPTLLEAGLDLELRDEYGRTPLMTQVLTAAPADAIRAVLAAGADPTATDEYTEQSVAELVDEWGRDDLGFLTEAAAAASSEGAVSEEESDD